MKIIIGTRGSKLALWQANYVKNEILKIYPNLQIEIKIIKTTGDIYSEKPISGFSSTGVFIKEIETSLLKNEIDIAVHSLKDMPSETPKNLSISGFMKRGTPNDVLILNSKDKFQKLKDGLLIGSGSMRRINQMKLLYPLTKSENIRGNIETRIKKVMDGNYDGTIITAAALERLNITDIPTYTFSLEEMVPAPGQGIICIENRSNDNEILKIIKSINCPETEIAAYIERSVLKQLNCGCNTPFGICSKIRDDLIETYYFFSSQNNKNIVKNKYVDSINKVEDIINNIVPKFANLGVRSLYN